MSLPRLLLAAAGTGRGFSAPEPPEPPFVPTAIAPDGSRIELFDRANTYTWSLVVKDGTGYLFTTESPSTEHAAGSGAYLRTSADDYASRTLLYAGGGAGRHGGMESAFLTSTGRILAVLDDQADADNFDVAAKVIYSDDGSTWSSPYTVPNTFSGDCVGGTFAEMPNGDVLLTLYGEETGVVGGNTFVKRVKSTDNGETFGDEITIASSASRNYGEPQIVLVDDVYEVYMRSDTTQHTWLTTSADGDSWSAASDVLVMSGPPQVLPLGGDALFMLARNNNTVWRPRWAARFSGTWSSPAEVESGETRELDSTGMAFIDATHFHTIYALADDLDSSTVYLQAWVIS